MYIPSCPRRSIQGFQTRIVTICFMMVTVFCASSTKAVVAELSVTADKTVAIVNGHHIKASELDVYMVVSQLPREQALEDFIDVLLVRSAAAAKKTYVPAETWNPELRNEIEYSLAKALSLIVPPPRVVLIVDHAWLKDSENTDELAAGRAQLVRLRDLVKAGATIPEAYNSLNFDGTNWHIGNHEEYPYDVIPKEAHDLPPGSLSEIIPGDGGLHLFKVFQRKEQIPPSDEFRTMLSSYLRNDATIDVIEAPAE